MRIVLIGDFNLYQILETNAKKINQLKSEFSFNMRSNFTTHIADGILDLVLNNQWSDIVQWIPSPYSDHFILCKQIWHFLRYKCKCRKVNSKHMKTITRYFKEGNVNINFRDIRACIEEMIKKMFDIVVAYLPGLNHYDIDGKGLKGRGWSNIFHYDHLMNIPFNII